MSLGGGALGASAFGAVEDLAEAISSGSVPCTKAAFVRRRLAGVFTRRGAELAIFKRGAAEQNVRSIWAMTRSEELVGEVRQSDMTVFVDAASFDGSSFELPIQHRDRLVRWPDTDREKVYTTLETPALFTIGGTDILYRLILRG